jgi:hypothetical protein
MKERGAEAGGMMSRANCWRRPGRFADCPAPWVRRSILAAGCRRELNDSFTSTPAVRGARASRSVCIHRIRLAARSDCHGRLARRFVVYAAQNAAGSGGGRRAQGDDDRAHLNFHLRHFSVLGGLAPRLSSAAAICNKSVSCKIGLIQDGPAISHRLDQARRIGEPDDQTH